MTRLTATPPTSAVPNDFAPCPTCHQYSHSIGDDELAEAHMHFEAMFSHRGDGIPTQRMFDETTRDMAQRLIFSADMAASGSVE